MGVGVKGWDPPLLGDPDGLYMSARKAAAVYLASRLPRGVILELCCGVGALTIAIARQCEKVFAVDIDPNRIQYAKENVARRGLTNVEFILGSALDYELYGNLSPDAVVADPDWAAKSESDKSRHTSSLSLTQPPTDMIHRLVVNRLTSNLVIRISPNVRKHLLKSLGPCEVETIIRKGHKTPRFLYLYFSDRIRYLRETIKYVDD